MMDTKEKILLTALDLFSRNGFEAVSVSMIADEIGITKGALYKHYTSKRDIFDAIVHRMEENDSQMAQSFDLPEDLFDFMPEAYRNTKLMDVCAFTLSMFVYWTEDRFASQFRRMITLEQYRDAEMNRLFQQYLGSGPLSYMEDIFREMFSKTVYSCSSRLLAVDFYGPVFMLISIYDGMDDQKKAAVMLKEHIESFVYRLGLDPESEVYRMTYPRSQKYMTPELMSMIMGPNPIKLEEELLENNSILPGSIVCDLGSGNGLTSVFLAIEYGFKVYASDLWSDPAENRRFFRSMGIPDENIIPVKADAMALPFEQEFFDAVVSVDSYNYFGRDKAYLGEKLLPFVKHGGYIYIAVPGMKKDCHDNLPEELLLSWSPEQMDFMHDADYWRSMIADTEGIEIISLKEMRSNREVWNDWLMQENEYAVGDRKSMEAGAGNYLNFIQIILRKK